MQGIVDGPCGEAGSNGVRDSLASRVGSGTGLSPGISIESRRQDMHSHLKQSLTAVALFVLALLVPLGVGAQDEPNPEEAGNHAIQSMLNKAGFEAGPEAGLWVPEFTGHNSRNPHPG